MSYKILLNGEWKEVSSYQIKDANGNVVAPTIINIDHNCVHLDCGRKYWPVSYVKKIIDDISEWGYDTLQLHYSEECGMRIESKTYPWLAGGDISLAPIQGLTSDEDSLFWTYEDVADIVNYAHAHKVDIIPSLDIPAHCNYLVKKVYLHDGIDIGNYFHYNGQTLRVGGYDGTNPYSRGIDIVNPIAVQYQRNLLLEHAKMFYRLGCRQFDIGGDELLGWGETIVPTGTASRWKQLDHWKDKAIEITGNANAVAYDMFLLYMQETEALLRNMGYKHVFMWNDQLFRTDAGWKKAVKISPSTDVFYWTKVASSITPVTYISNGNKIYNAYEPSKMYFVFRDTYTNPTVANMISFSKNKFGSDYTCSESEGAIRGSMFCIWCDNPVLWTCDEAYEMIRPLLYAKIKHKAL